MVVRNIRFCFPKKPLHHCEIAENGEPGQERKIELELKVLADVGLVGFPSVGNQRYSLYYLVRSSENWCLSFYDVSSKLRDGDY